tara:strand:+ start:323 stop:511 length:189 start_codon:yes stop_codon:yes gene_type:complete
MLISLRYLDKFSARAGNHNWISDPTLYCDNDVMKRLSELQALGYIVEMTFIVKKEVDLGQEF